MLPAPASAQSVDARKASSAQLEAEKNLLLQLIQGGSCRVSFNICAAGRAPVWTLFRKVFLDSQLTPFVVCQVCGKLLKYTSRDGTKSMKLHMAKCTQSSDSQNPSSSNTLDSNSVTPGGGGTIFGSANNDGRSSSSAVSSWDSASMTPSRGFQLPLCSPNHLSNQEDSTLDLSLSHSPSAAVTSLTPALSLISEPPAPSLNQAALQTVAKALQSALQIFDGDVNEVESEIANLENKLISLNAKRNELIRRKETVRRAAAAVCCQVGSDGQPATTAAEDPDYDVIPSKKSRRKQSSSDVRHFSPVKVEFEPSDANAANSS